MTDESSVTKEGERMTESDRAGPTVNGSYENGRQVE